MIHIALVDDHILLRKGLAIMIDRFPGCKVILQACNGKELMTRLRGPLPDIVLADMIMPCMDGLETTKLLGQMFPDIKVVGLSMSHEKPLIAKMQQYGARGYLLKNSEPAELEAALKEIHEKGYHYDQVFTRPTRKIPIISDAADLLTEQEKIFLRWACTDKSHKEIAAEMCVSPRTIDGYRDIVFRKLKVCSRVGIALYAIKNGIVVL